MSTTAPCFDLVTLGEPMILLLAGGDLPLPDADRFDVSVAGAESNLAIGLARLGHRIGYFTRIGEDAFGERIQRVLRGEGVAVDTWTVDRDRPTGILIRDTPVGRPISVDYRRAATAASALSADDVPADLFRSARICHVTGITAALSEQNFTATRQAMITAADAGATVSFDPNVRLRIADLPRWQTIVSELAQHADIVFTGRDEAETISHGVSPQDWYADRGASIVVVKDGAAGATEYALATAAAATSTGREFTTVHEEVRGVPLVDPVGAGDAFNAGWLSAWLNGADGPHHPDARRRLATGAAVASTVVSVRGDATGLPSRAVLQQMLAGAADVIR